VQDKAHPPSPPPTVTRPLPRLKREARGESELREPPPVSRKRKRRVKGVGDEGNKRARPLVRSGGRDSPETGNAAPECRAREPREATVIAPPGAMEFRVPFDVIPRRRAGSPAPCPPSPFPPGHGSRTPELAVFFLPGAHAHGRAPAHILEERRRRRDLADIVGPRIRISAHATPPRNAMAEWWRVRGNSRAGVGRAAGRRERRAPPVL
jgi:hypothetical protein